MKIYSLDELLFLFGTWGFFEGCTEKLPFRVDFIHRLELGEVSGHRVLIKRGPGNRGPTECGATHEATGFSSCGSRALEHKLRSCGPQHVGCVIRCSIACGIFSNQQSKPRLLHWQEDSLPLSYQGSPAAAAAAKSLQSCPTLCDPIDGSPPGFPVPGILQARTLEWVFISFFNA